MPRRTTTPDPHIAPYALWSSDDSVTAWHALLGEVAGGPDVPAPAAPARLEDATGLPAAYIEVGQLDVFRDEVPGKAPALTVHAGQGWSGSCAPEGIRTPNLLIRSQMLYPLSYRRPSPLA